jgi:hydroxymethylpyrimidine/phosphomethylpyrimidine kinase
MPSAPPVVLTIAGFDPSSGAGITADIKVIAAHECYGIACPTALTVQSTQGVRRVCGVDPKVVAETLDELASDFPIHAVHIGMLDNEHVATAVADFLVRGRLPHVVLDPILKSSSGAALLDPAGVRVLVERLIPLAELITPNLEEAVALTGMAGDAEAKAATAGSEAEGGRPSASSAASLEPSLGTPLSTSLVTSLGTSLGTMREAAARLHALGAVNVVVTGGDTGKAEKMEKAEKAIDLLSFATLRGIEQEVFKAQRQRSSSTHGTGCAFSTALACHLALGRGLPEAVLLSKAYVSAAIANGQPLGHGTGPLHHLYRMHETRRASAVISEAEHAHTRN